MLEKLKNLSGTTYLLVAALLLSLLGRYFDIFVLKLELTLAYVSFSSIIISSLAVLVFKSFKTEKYIAESFYLLGAVYLSFTCYFVDLVYINTYTQFFLIILLLKFQKNNFIYLHSLMLITAGALCYYAFKINYYTESQAIDRFLTTFCEWVFTFIVHRKVYAKQVSSIEEMTPFYSLGKTTSFLLHEIQSPLAQLERSASPLKKEITQNISEIRRIIDVSKSMGSEDKNHKIVNLSLNELLDKVIESYKSQIKFLNIQIIKDLEVGFIKSDTTSLQIILRNLIKNSLEAGLETEKEHYSKIKTSSIEGYTYIKVSNPTDHKTSITDNIFKAGFSTKKSSSNMGHGLYLTKKVVEDLDGTISASIENGIFNVEVALPQK